MHIRDVQKHKKKKKMREYLAALWQPRMDSQENNPLLVDVGCTRSCNTQYPSSRPFPKTRPRQITKKKERRTLPAKLHKKKKRNANRSIYE